MATSDRGGVVVSLIARRIGRGLVAEIRDASSDHHASGHVAFLEGQLRCWQTVHPDEMDRVRTGHITTWTHHDFTAGDHVLLGSSWWSVTRVNKATLSVRTHGSSARVPYRRILARCSDPGDS